MAKRKRKYRTYTLDFKARAVAQFNATPTRKRGALAQKLGVQYNNLYNWAQKASDGGIQALHDVRRSVATAHKSTAAGKHPSEQHIKRQKRLLAELQETCLELQQLRDNYAQREKMVLAHIKHLTASLDRTVLANK